MENWIEDYKSELLRLSELHEKYNEDVLTIDERLEYSNLVDELEQYLPVINSI